MTPVEKSEELYLKYKEALNIQNDMRPGKNPFAKQCAIICVEQIIPCTWKQSTYKKEGKIWVDEITTTEYWEEVLTILKTQK